MKKFLTVLLVIAVMFTFSFGSAFAATPAPAADQYARANVSALYTYVAEAQAKVEAAIDKAESDALYAIFQGKASVKLGAGSLVVTSEQVKAYYDSEVVAKAKAQVSKEASEIYAAIQTALNAADTEYIGVVSAKDQAGAWDANADGKVTGYNVYVGFSGTVDGKTAPDYDAVFDEATLTGTKAADIAKDAFAAMATAKLAEIAAITPESYVAKDQEKVAELKAKASTLVTKLANRVANNSFNFENVAAAYTGTLTLDADVSAMTEGFAGALAAIYTPAVNEAPATGALTTELAKLTLSADEPTQAAKLAWAKAQVMKKYEDAINAQYDTDIEAANNTLLNESLKGAKADQSKIDAANETIETAKKVKDAALEIATYLVNDCDDLKLFIEENTSNFAASTVRFGTGKFTVDGKEYNNWNYNGTDKRIASPLIKTAEGKGFYGNLVKVVEYVQDVKDQATALRNDIAIDGTIAVDIDALEKDAIDAVYKTGAAQTLPNNTANLVLHTRQHALTGVDCFGDALTAKTVKVDGKTYSTVDAWEEAKYEAARLDEVKAIKKETKAAIMDATTVADAEAAFLAGLEKYKAVLDTDAKALNQAAKAFVDLKAKYAAQLAADLDYTIAGIEAAKANNNAAGRTTYLNKLNADLAKAYTTDELTEAYNKLSAEVKALKDKTTLDAEKKALEERCKAFSNVTVTLDNKADLVALRNDVAAFRTYVARIGASYTVADYGLNNKVVAVANLEKKAIEDQYKAINKDGKATLEEADAVKALRAAVDAYNDGWDEFAENLEDNAGFVKPALSVANLEKFEKDIFNAQVDAVESAIAKLPADGSDITATKAARKAYDALTLCQKVTVADKYYDKLVDVEKVIGKAVTSLKIKASSKATKGAMTIKWRVIDGDKSAAAGYQVWRSTKANKGFKKMITTKKMTYKNTKNLKKGTTYYYRVRAYARVDGKLYFSDFSNKAYRKAK